MCYVIRTTKDDGSCLHVCSKKDGGVQTEECRGVQGEYRGVQTEECSVLGSTEECRGYNNRGYNSRGYNNRVTEQRESAGILPTP